MEERKYCIATGKSRFERCWHNEAVTWEWLVERMRQPVVTSETMSDYRAMSRERQTAVKDVGGFVGGYLTNGRRAASSVGERSLVTLDYDDFDAEHLEKLRGALSCRWLLHSTHKHRDDAWRVRLVVPVSRGLSADEYGAVARRLAQTVGMDGIDRSTFEPCRLMFWPSRSSDAPYLFETGEGEPLDVTETLRSYDDWTDMSSWPLLPGEEAAMLADPGAPGEPLRAARAFRETGRHGRQEDPLEKKGIVGTFCRTYGIAEAIARFLPSVYEKARGNRYTHVGSSTHGGAWVLDGNRFLYSFHGTDPAQGRLLNAWDLVRVHRFGAEDAGSRGEARAERLPSYKLMEELAMGDGGVKLTLRDERRARVSADFDGLDLESPVEEGELTPEQEEWNRICGTLTFAKDGTLKTTSATAAIVIDKEPRLTGRIRFNDFTGDIDVCGTLPWRRNGKTWTNLDSACLRVWLDREFGLSGKEKIGDALKNVANAHGYHPVKDYLTGLKWDGVKRIEGLFTDVLGAERSVLNAELAKLIFKAACRRIFNPGEKFDYFVILQGPEGCGKSSLFSLMGGEWFSDSVVTIEGKDGMEAVQGAWIIEIGELIGVKKSAVEQVKGFISREVDTFRPAYGEIKEKRPRQCVLVGTTNDELFLRGINTGNRRQPVVEVRPELRTVEEPVRDYVARLRDQLWAEAMELHREGTPLMLAPELDDEVRRVQDEHNLDKTNPLFPEVARFLDFYLPEDWEKKSLDERLVWLKAQNDPTEASLFNSHLRERITVPEILQELFEMKRTDKEYLSRSREIGQYLNSLKGEWENIGPRKSKVYGNQKTWKRKNLMTTEENQGLGSLLNDL